MKNLFKKLVIASACISMTVTAIPVNNSIITPVTVQAVEKSGLYHEGSSWNYYKDGAIATDTTTLVKYNNSWWYVKNGKIDFSATTLFKKDGVWWYIHNGEVDFSARTLVKYNGTWWYVNNGQIDWHTETVVRYGNAWYHVKNGQVDWKSETLVKYNNEWWYVKDGTIKFGATTLCRYNGTWWYVHNGKVDFSATTLCRYNRTWWYINNGQIDWHKRTLIKYGNTWYYVNNGLLDWAFNGTCEYNGYVYAVRGGVVDFSVKPVKNNDWISNLDISKKTDQIIVVEASGSSAVVSMHDRDENGVWSQVLSTNGYVGKNGIGKTREGDRKTPTGVYSFSKAFGNSSDPGCAFDYTHCDSSYYWVDDSTSDYYNQLVSTRYVYKDWDSAEHISAVGARYNYVLALDYNSDRKPWLGSAIFLHCGTSYTSGCIAVPESVMVQIMRNVRMDCLIVIDSPENIEKY